MAMLNIRLNDEEAQQIEAFRQTLQEHYGSKVRVTQKTVILTALETLSEKLEELKEGPPQQETRSFLGRRI
jgi:ribosomal protein L10